jgi:SAM-dependent methyltransferase
MANDSWGVPMQLTYNPEVFAANSIPAAMSIILTAEDATTEQRWRTETPYLADLINEHLELSPNSWVLDYGCGIGRMAKELIARHGCQVAGVDISPTMRALAPMYVASDRFFSCASAMLDGFIERGIAFDAAISIWVLQHCLYPGDDIARIKRALRPEGKLFVMNNIDRAVPTREIPWVNDGIDLRSVLGREFTQLAKGAPAKEHTTPDTSERGFWAVFQVP